MSGDLKHSFHFIRFIFIQSCLAEEQQLRTFFSLSVLVSVRQMTKKNNFIDGCHKEKAPIKNKSINSDDYNLQNLKRQRIKNTSVNVLNLHDEEER